MNTIEILSQLEKVKFTTEQARTITSLFEERHDRLATKDDIRVVREDLGTMRRNVEKTATKDELKIAREDIEMVREDLKAMREDLEKTATKDELIMMREDLEMVQKDLKNTATRDELKMVREDLEKTATKDELIMMREDLEMVQKDLKNTATKDELNSSVDSLKIMIESGIIKSDANIAKAKYDLVRWIVGAVIVNGVIATLLKLFA